MPPNSYQRLSALLCDLPHDTFVVWQVESIRTDARLVRAWLRGIRAAIAVPRPSPFTYVERNPVGVFGIILLVGFIPDAFFRHLLVPHRYDIVNAIADALELLTAAWVCGAYAMMMELPHSIVGDALRLHFGAFARIDVPLSAIASIQSAGEEKTRVLRRKHPGAVFLAAFGTPLVRIDLSRDVIVWSYPFLRPRTTRTLFVASDRPLLFAEAVKGANPATA